MDDIVAMDKKIVQRIIDTLNSIPVCGEDNLDKMLGVILTLRQAMNPPKSESVTETITASEE